MAAAGGDGADVRREDSKSAGEIAELISDHRAAIDELRRRVADACPGEDDGVWLKYDDLFYLRYILSFSKPASAEAAARKCFQLRGSAGHRAMATSLRDAGFTNDALLAVNGASVIMRFEAGGFLEGAHRNGGIVVCFRMGPVNYASLHATISHQEYYDVFMAVREHAYHHCDRVAREEGRLVKFVLLIDETGIRLSDMMNPRYTQVATEVSAISGWMYPQLVEKMALCNAPGFMTAVLRFFRTFLPRSVTDKVEIFSTAEQLWGSEWARRTLVRERMPSFVGGTLPDAELPPELNGSMLDPESDRSVKLVVPSRSASEVRVPVPFAGSRVRFSVCVEEHGVNLGARLLHGSGPGIVRCQAAAASGASTTLRAIDADASDKIRAEAGAVRGEWTCDAPGVLVVTFDNSYSRLRSKTVLYSLDVEPPEGAAEAVESEAAAAGTAGAAGGAGASGAADEGEIEAVL